MCGLAGIIFGKKRRTAKERQHLLDIFTRLLVLSEARGHHATGVAWVNTDGTYDLFKAPMPASEFVQESRYADLLAGVDNKTTILMGHTRWRTQGSEFNNDNNHPIMVGNAIITHNGHITNAHALFQRLRFRRFAQVDSEILAHMTARASSAGKWDLRHLGQQVSLCEGTMALVAASVALPDRIIIFRDGKKPLAMLYSERCRALMYASAASSLCDCLPEGEDWQGIAVRAMTLIEILPRRKTAFFNGVNARERGFSD